MLRLRKSKLGQLFIRTQHKVKMTFSISKGRAGSLMNAVSIVGFFLIQIVVGDQQDDSTHKGACVKPGDLSSLSRTHMVEAKIQLLKVVF